MKRIKVYESVCGYWYITDKIIEWAKPEASFDNVCDAESYMSDHEGTLMLDRDLVKESGYNLEGDNFDLYTFDFKEEFEV